MGSEMCIRDRLWDEGLVVVAAAGNQGPEPGSVTAPGCSKKVITVGSSDMLTGKGAVSGRGPTFECVCKPDLVAPEEGSLPVHRDLPIPME